MKLEATLEERTSKDGNKYECIVVKITDNVEKIVFLTPADKELLRIRKNAETNSDEKTPFDFD